MEQCYGHAGCPGWKEPQRHLDLEDLESCWNVEHPERASIELVAYQMKSSTACVTCQSSEKRRGWRCTHSKRRDGFQLDPPSDVIGMRVGACEVLAWLAAVVAEAIMPMDCAAGESLLMSRGPAEMGGVIGWPG